MPQFLWQLPDWPGIENELRKANAGAATDPFVSGFKGLTIGQATRVWDAADGEERDLIRRAFVFKIDSRRKDSRDSDERAQLSQLRAKVMARENDESATPAITQPGPPTGGLSLVRQR